MLGEVVPHEYVEQVGVTAEVCIGERDQLTVAGRRGVLGRPDEERRLLVDERGGYEQGRRDRGGGLVDNLHRGEEVATDQAVEQEGGVVVRHRDTVRRAADDALTVR